MGGAAGHRVTGVQLVQDLSALSGAVTGFLRRHRHRAKSVFDDGRRSDAFVVDYADRAPGRRDAVVVMAFERAPGACPEEARVLLRRQLRYPVYLVSGQPMFLEAVAGIIEGDEPVAVAAARELAEEGGFTLSAGAFSALGPPFFPCAALFTERIHPVAVALAPGALARGPDAPPPGDGSPLEEGAELLSMTLADALATCAVDPDEDLHIADAKTEIGLRRLLDRLREEPA